MRDRRSQVEESKQEVLVESGLKVNYRDSKTGLQVKKDPYILRFVGDGGNKVQLWERPAGSGNLWSKPAGGKPAGRWDKSKPEGSRHLVGADHVEWNPPETKDQLLAREYAEQSNRIKELEAELSAIRMEKEKKAGPSKKESQGV